MQQIVAISEIKTRAEAIGLSLKRLARDAGVHSSTAYRGASGKTSDPRGSTLRKLTRALQTKEAERLAELNARAGEGA